MRENRNESRNPQQNPKAPVLAAETLRSAAATSDPEPLSKGTERISTFWRVFGGTLLSIAALAIITICQHFSSGLNEVRSELSHGNADLRKDIGRLNEALADLVKKDEFATRTKSIWDSIKELQVEKTTSSATKERLALLEQRVKAYEEDCKELVREVQRIRQLKAVEEDRKDLVRELQCLRERLAALEGRPTPPSVIKSAVHRED